MRTQGFDRQSEKDEPAPQLKLVFAYYCKLNSKKAKHKMFEDFNEKAETMNLHEFMTFCKNFQITTKQHKRIENHLLSQFLKSKREQNIPKDDGQVKKNDAVKQMGQSMIKNLTNLVDGFAAIFKQQAQVVSNQFIKASDQNSISEGLAPTQKPLQHPGSYLNEKKLAEIFKKETSQQGEIYFDTFVVILRRVSHQMYENVIREVKQTQNIDSNSLNPQESKEVVVSKASQRDGSLTKLLKFLNLDSKYHILETFAKVNEFYGTMEHLSLMRSPIKKLNLKNYPLGKHAKKSETNKQNTSKSRLSLFDKGEKSLQRLPRVTKPSRNKDLLIYAKNDVKSISKEQLSVFMLANKSQIEHLNKSYLKNIGNIISQDSTNRDISMEAEHITLKAGTISNQKSAKKYSQMHKDKVIGDINHKQIGKLIDISSLYDDQIFNKYVELNYKNAQKSPAK